MFLLVRFSNKRRDTALAIENAKLSAETVQRCNKLFTGEPKTAVATSYKRGMSYDDPKKVAEETENFRRLAFRGIVVSTIATLTAIVAVPMLYNYMQHVQSSLQSEVDFCRHRTDSLWNEYHNFEGVTGVEGRIKRSTYQRGAGVTGHARRAVARRQTEGSCCSCGETMDSLDLQEHLAQTLEMTALAMLQNSALTAHQALLDQPDDQELKVLQEPQELQDLEAALLDQDHQDQLDQPELQETTDSQELQELQELQDKSSMFLALQDQPDHQDQPDQLEPQDSQEHQETPPQELQDQPETPVRQEPQEAPELQESLDKMESPVALEAATTAHHHALPLDIKPHTFNSILSLCTARRRSAAIPKPLDLLLPLTLDKLGAVLFQHGEAVYSLVLPTAHHYLPTLAVTPGLIGQRLWTVTRADD
ncbi:unnamed protein product [Caenorhabditis auriculariae]|uniref:Nematode cuticle collagen N-terminal domain-containing protein n=1 Tax=Caenorhabditis auriculariae TaxID=2777116 RepID=A0A8S1GPE1_9PELO|nr:unnamed protein product [Caenorhabditis auriculariae]